MPIAPVDWTVVIVGSWNRAILTPAGIVRRLFQLPEATPVDIEVPLDAVAPYSVKHEGVTVMAGRDRLIVEPSESNYDRLADALKVARRALKNLPETPVRAAGYNAKFRSDGPVGSFAEITAHRWDDSLTDEGFEIESRAIGRVLPWRGGRIKVSLTQEPNLSFTLLLNYDLQSTSVEKLVEWLDVPLNEVRAQTERILFKCLDVRVEDFGDVDGKR